MINKAIMELKEKRGSSRQAIMKHMSSNSKVVPKTFLKKMIEEGVTIPGAKAGQSGSGCFKMAVKKYFHPIIF